MTSDAALAVMAHHDDRTHFRPRQVRVRVPNVSGGLVTSDIEQRTDWNYDHNARLAQTAENNGFEYALSQVRYKASYGAEYQHESTAFRWRCCSRRNASR